MNYLTLPRRRHSERPPTRRPRKRTPRAPAEVTPKYCPTCKRGIGVNRLLDRRLVEVATQSDDERANSRAAFLAEMRVVDLYDDRPQGRAIA